MADDLLSGQINFTGLGSGTDFQTMIDKLIEIEGTHKRKLENWKQEWELKNEAITHINSAMLELRTTLSSMDTMNSFLTKNVASTNEGVLTASADADAEVATHSVQIKQLAKNAIIVSKTGYANKDDKVVGSSSEQFAYSYAGEEYALDVAAGTTLEGLVNLINSDPDNPGVRASLVSDGSNYHLQIRGLDLGSNASLSFNAAGSTMTDPGFDDASDFETTQVNQNAMFKVDGWPSASDAWIQTDSNTVSDVIEGITLNFKSTGDSPPTEVQISVATDLEGVSENVHTFVEKVNEVRSMMMELTKFDDVEQRGSIMTGNYAFQLVDSQLKQASAGLAKGFIHYDEGPPPTGDFYSTLSQVGILTDAEKGSATEGLLVIDEELLADTLASNVDAVAALFAADSIGDQKVDSGNFSYYSHLLVTEPGAYDVKYEVSGGAITSASIAGSTAKVDNSAGTITAMDGPAKGLVIKINDFPNDSSGSGVIQIKQGKTGELANLLKQLTSQESGPMHILEDNYDDIIQSIDKKIDYETVRLDRMARDLRNRFARLEATLGQYDQINTSLASQIGQLSQK
ncbi:flagellar filament capping protein FliD [Oceanidesulfovibrio marinus]|uniref:Flagellar hook-associated protein 2 n=1 Tax=Oceanidesulfovibrio marinus TaxID=370038 RepID=A0A6P1ZKV1_9BACT|nr:flagellar filament capping protein FliD [Oceanidesulfovibrio marinus]TVM36402.1 flagellar hook protein [Oceanidesulfovibrio marinus]